MQYTNCITYKLFDDEDLSRINLLINNTNDDDWKDGLKSTTHNNKEIKNNLELSNKTYRKSIENIVKEKINKNDFYVNFTAPFTMTTPIISKTCVNGYYNLHEDSHSLGNFSTTVFLTDPNDYDGGELSLYFENKKHSFKLKKGHAVTYKTGIPHKVNKLTKGHRIALIFWTTSKYEDVDIRSIVYKLNILKNSVSNQLVYDFSDIDKNPSYVIRDIKNILEKKYAKRK